MDENTKNDQVIDQNTKIKELKKQILLVEESLEAAKRALFELTGDQIGQTRAAVDYSEAQASGDGKVIEGIFNGENMVGPEGKIYPVPANYASKSKLVEGDKLKLTISDDGKFLFKQIAPIKRKTMIGTLKFENNAYHVLSEGHSYNILYASVTFHKAKPGDKVSVIVPESGSANWAVLESVIHDIAPVSTEATQPQPTAGTQAPEGAKEIENIEIKPHEQPVELHPEADSKNSEAKNKLAIDDMDINSLKKQESPDAVNPSILQNNQTSNPPAPPPKSEPAKPIAEMDI